MAIFEIEDPSTGEIYEIESPNLPSSQALKNILNAVSGRPAEETPSSFFGGGATRGSGASATIPFDPIFEQLSIEQFPILGTTQDILGQVGIGTIQGLTGGAAQAFLKKGGQEFPEPVTTAGKVARGAAGIAGTVAGVVGGAGLKAAQFVGKSTASLVAKGAAAGFAGGLAITPDSDTGEMLQVGKRLTNALIGGVLGGGLGAAVRGLSTTKNLIFQTKFADKVIQEYNHVMNQASIKFGDAINRLGQLFPKQRVDLSKAVTAAKETLDDSPGLRTTIKRFPKLKEIFDSPNKAKNLTLKEAQEIKNSIKYVKAPRPEDLPINDLKNAMTKAQIDAFPQFKDQLSEYTRIAKDYDLLNNMVKDGKIIGAVKKGFGDAQVKDAVIRTFGKETVAEMGGIKNATSVAKGAWRLGKLYILWRVFRGSFSGSGGN